MSDPAALDAGYLQASPDIQEFRTHGDSGTLGLPLPGFAAQARAGTDARLEELFPGFSVIGDGSPSRRGRLLINDAVSIDWE